jgi:hypothetical protein
LDAALRRSASHIAQSFTLNPDSWRIPKLVLVRNKMPVTALPKEHNWKAAQKKEVEKTWLAPKVKAQSVRVANTWVPMLSPTMTVLVTDKAPSEETLCEGVPQATVPIDAKQFLPVALGEHVQWLSILGQKACVFAEDKGGLGVPAKGAGAEPSAKLKIWCPVGALFVPLAPDLLMPDAGTWAQGALAWQLQTQLQLYPSKDDLRREILKQSWACGVVTDVGSYIVVENSAQWKMLELKQRQTLAANAALDTVEAPAPSMALLVFGLIVFIAARRLYISRQT